MLIEEMFIELMIPSPAQPCLLSATQSQDKTGLLFIKPSLMEKEQKKIFQLL